MRLANMVVMASFLFGSSASLLAGNEIDPFATHISIGRMAVMTGQGEEALGMLPAEKSLEENEEDVTSPEALYAALYETVLAYDRLQAKACARDAVATELCEEPFFPRWLKLPGTQKANLEKIQKWADEAAERIAPLSGALCDRAVKEGADPSLCAIE